MTVQELIEALNKVGDKSKKVYNFLYCSIDEIQEDESNVILW